MPNYLDESTFVVVENKKIIAEIINNGSEKTKLDKIRFATEITNGKKFKLYCKCAVGDYRNILEYKISSDYKIYPARHNNLGFHKLYCSKNYENQESIKYNKGFQENEDGTITVKLIDLEKRKNSEIIKSYNTHMYDFKRINDGMLSISAFVKNTMLKIYEEYSTAERDNYSINDFLKYFYNRKKDFLIQGYGKKSLNDLKLESSGIEFIFGKLSKVIKTESGNYKVIFDSGNNNERSAFISKREFELMYLEFKETYKQKGIKLSLYPIIIAGFKISQKNSKYYDTNFHLILTNNYGLLCDSMYELRIFDYISEYLIDNKLWGKVSFYKPYRFGFSIYSYNYDFNDEKISGDYLEDAVMTIKNRSEVFVVDILPNNDDHPYKYNKKDFFVERLKNYNIIQIDSTEDDMEILESSLDKIKKIITLNKI